MYDRYADRHYLNMWIYRAGTGGEQSVGESEGISAGNDYLGSYVSAVGWQCVVCLSVLRKKYSGYLWGACLRGYSDVGNVFKTYDAASTQHGQEEHITVRILFCSRVVSDLVFQVFGF